MLAVLAVGAALALPGGARVVLAQSRMSTPPAASTATPAALGFVRALDRGDWSAAAKRVSPAVANGAMSAERLQQIWAQLTGSLGALRAIGDAAESTEGARRVVDLPARFDRSEVTLRVVLDSARQVAGFWVAPPRPPEYVTPPYVDTTAFREVELQVGRAPQLPAVLTLPKSATAASRAPVVVLVHGSGPSDRDERVGANRPFRDLAWGLASRGVAVLRYDKRTFAHPTGGVATIDAEVVDDAVLGIDAARGATGVDPARVVVLGHSLGGTFAPAIARRSGRVAALVLLAPGGRPLAEAALGQLDYLASLPPDASRPAAALDAARTQLKAIAARTLPPTTTVLGAPASYWYDAAVARPLDVLRATTLPTLALFGGRDYQVTAADEALVREALAGNRAARVTRHATLSHLFAEGPGMATPEEYLTRTGHVAPVVIDEIARFVLSAPPATAK